MRATRLFLAAVLAVAVGLTGCGIPDETGVVVRGPGPSPGAAVGDGPAPAPIIRDSTTDPQQFVTNFLAAAAGELPDAVNRVKAFLDPKLRTDFKPATSGLTVVRLRGQPEIDRGSLTVTLKVQQLGVLTETGQFDEPTTDRAQYVLQLGEVAGETGLFVRAPLPDKVLLLSEDALKTYYERRPIYFWNSEGTALVPDLRYLPRAVPRERQPSLVVDWLVGGPSDWLGGPVVGLPTGIRPVDKPIDAGDSTLQVNLTGPRPADARAVDDLATQLLWSLRPNLSGQLVLKIDNVERRRYPADRADFLARNPFHNLTDVPERYAVHDGQMRRLTTPTEPGDAAAVLTDAVNRNVRSAALGRVGTSTYAALVTTGQRTLMLQILGASADGKSSGLTADLKVPVASRPVWLSLPSDGKIEGAVGLIAADGRLLRFVTGATDPQPVRLPGDIGAVTAVAASPDGRRVAFIADGRLYVTVLAPGDGAPQPRPRPVPTSLTRLDAVDWSSEDSLVVAGLRQSSQRVALVDVTVDGALETDRLDDAGARSVTDLVAHPARPSTAGGAVAVAYMGDRTAYDAYSVPKPIEAAQVVGITVGPKTPRPTAPFFVD